MGISPFSNIDIQTVQAAISNIRPTVVEREIRDTLLSELPKKVKRQLTIDDKRIAASAAYTISVLSNTDGANATF